VKKHVALIVAAVTAVAVVHSHVDLVQRDERTVVQVNGRLHDVQGWLAETGNRLTRRCEAIKPPSPEDAHAMLQAVRAYSPPDSWDGRLLQAWQLGPWAVAEVHFSRLKPTLVVLQQAPTWRVQPQAVWSGSTAPWRVNDFVRRYLRQQAPDLPAALLDCVEVEPLHFLVS